MTANISQHVTPRHRAKRGVWRTQRGSVNQATITVTAGMIALVVVGMLGFFYLRQVVGTASQGTNIHDLEMQLGDLKERQRQLELEGAQLRSLQAVEEQVQDLNLVEAERVSYLAAEEDRVATVSGSGL